MTNSSVGSCGMAPWQTASAIVARAAPVFGSHVLKIDGYSRTKGLGTGKYITSEKFTAGGHSWCMKYYPDGDCSDYADWISIFLILDRADVSEVRAQYTISLLDQVWNPVPSYSMKTCHTFSSGELWGGELIRRKDLESSVYLRNDVFSVRCDITVIKIFTKAIIPAPAVRRGIKKKRHGI